MLLALLASLPGVSFASQDAPPPCPYDEVLELELTSDDEPLENRGPALWIEHEVEFAGGLHIWAEAENGLDLMLRVDDDSFELRGQDEDSGGGTTPYLHLTVESGERLMVAVAAQVAESLGDFGVVQLHLVAAPESAATLAAAQEAVRDLASAKQSRDEGRLEECRAVLASSIAELRSVEGWQWSDWISDGFWRAANVATTIRDYAMAREAYALVAMHRERSWPKDHPNLRSARIGLGLATRKTGDLAGARALEEAVLETCERTLPDGHYDLAVARLKVAGAMAEARELEDARPLYELVLVVFERLLPEDHWDLISTRLHLAVVLQDMGELEDARKLLELGLEGCERIYPEGHHEVIGARVNLANTLRLTGELEEARALLEAALEVGGRSLPEDHPFLLIARNNLAATLQAMGDPEGARALFEAVLEAAERSLPEDDPKLLGARMSLAVTLTDMEDFEGACALFEAVLEAGEGAGPEQHETMLLARQGLAGCRVGLGDFEAGRALVEAVLEARERTLPEDHPSLVLARANLAGIMGKMGELEGSRALFEAVLEVRERTLPEDHPRLLGTRRDLALSMWSMGDLEGARALLSAQIAGMRLRALSAAALSPREARQVIADDSLSLAQALSLEQALSLAQALSLTQDPASSEDGASALRQSLFELIETRRVVSIEGLRLDAVAAADPRVTELRAAALRASEELNAVVLRGAQAGLDRDAFGHAARERDRTQRKLREALAERGVHVDEVGLAQLAGALPEGSAAIGFLRYDRWERNEEARNVLIGSPQLLAHVARADGSLVRVELGDAAELDALIEDWRPSTGVSTERGVPTSGARAAGHDLDRAPGEALRQRLLDPLLAAAGEEVETLYVCPDDLVYLVPLDALPLGDGLVGDSVVIRVLGSLSGFVAPRSVLDSEPRLLALGGATYDAEGAVLSQSFSPLPQTSVEVESIAALFERSFDVEAVLLEGSGATKSALALAIAGKRYVHLATHGWFAPETVRSILDEATGSSSAQFGAEQRVTGFAPLALCGLALAGANRAPDARGRRPGILTAEELARLPLEGCELAVLSACETNVGRRRAGQGIQSLQAALHAAGARWTITTLWKVDDVWARRLMELFYEHLWVDHLPVPDALWRAKQELIAAGAPARAWAPWVLSGTVR